MDTAERLERARRQKELADEIDRLAAELESREGRPVGTPV
jgi:hypothetical protein